jgi:prefoldin subunit 5
MKIHVEGPEGEVYDICVTYDPWPGMDLLVMEWDDQTVPAGGEILVDYPIPSSADVGPYRMEVWNSARTQAYLWVNYSVIPFSQMVLDLLLELQDETTELSSQLASLQQDLSQLEGNVSQLQTDIDNLQSTLSSIQTGLAAVIDDIDDLASSMDDLQDQIDDLEDQIEDLQADVTNLEEKQASESDFAGTNDLLTYLALIFGIAGLVIGLLAMFRKGPSLPQVAPIEQPIRQP